MNGPNKLESYITFDWKSLQWTNTLAYWDQLKVMKKMKCCDYNSWSCNNGGKIEFKTRQKNVGCFSNFDTGQKSKMAKLWLKRFAQFS
jgi:hypothetical protein